MATIKERDHKGTQQSTYTIRSTHKDRVWQSSVWSIDPIPATSVYRAAQVLQEEERFFWQTNDRSLTMVGFGAAFTIAPEHKYLSRFSSVEQQWKRFIGKVDTSVLPYGTGPLLFGGFSFFEEPSSNDAWQTFGAASFIVPKFMYTESDGKAYWTETVVAPTELLQHHIQDQDELSVKCWSTLVNREEKIDLPHLVQEENPCGEEWKSVVKRATNAMEEGNFNKVVLAREQQLTFSDNMDVATVLRNLSEEQQNSFVFSYAKGDHSFMGATPERLIRKNGNRVYSHAIAGTMPRGETLQGDFQLGDWLLQDVKNGQEHAYVVELIQSVFESLCEDVVVAESPSLLKMKHVQHLHTPIQGTVTDSATLLPFVEKLHPTPALGGSPRPEALQFIREHEPLDRGWYAGPIGWVDMNGNGEFVVAIRSARINRNEAVLYAGCGIVSDSTPVEEWDETLVKLKPMRTSLGVGGDLRGE